MQRKSTRAMPAPSAAEPVFVRHVFTHNPLLAARNALMEELQQAAVAGIDSMRPVLRHARTAMACRLLGSVTPTEEVRADAGDGSLRYMAFAAGAPAVNVGEVIAKLALLVRDLAGQDDGENGAVRLQLAAAALADLVLIGEGPIARPQGGAEPIETEADAARWRARTAARMGRPDGAGGTAALG